MAVIGSFGPIIFEVTEDKILTFDGFTRTTESRYIEHKVRYIKPRLEFEGPGIDPVRFTIRLRAEFGINPEKTMDAIRSFARRGHRDLFIRGGKPISSNSWVIQRAEEVHKRVDGQGNVLEMEVSLELLEYVNDVPNEFQKKTTSNVKSTSNSSKNKPTGKIKINVKSVNIRSGPGVNNKVIGYAMNGNELKVYGEKNGWYQLGGGKYISANDSYSTFKKGAV